MRSRFFSCKIETIISNYQLRKQNLILKHMKAKTNFINLIGLLILVFTGNDTFAQPTRMRAYENTSLMSGNNGNNGNGNSQMVTICHQTGNGTITITVNQNAVNAHLAHGDVIGSCTTVNHNDSDDDNDDSDDDNDDSDDDNEDSDNDNEDSDDNNCLVLK